jgi:hypothetical protein
MPVPFWDDDSTAWDRLYIGGLLAPGFVRDINVVRGRNVQMNAGPGIDGANLVAQGRNVAEVPITLEIVGRESLKRAEAFMPTRSIGSKPFAAAPGVAAAAMQLGALLAAEETRRCDLVGRLAMPLPALPVPGTSSARSSPRSPSTRPLLRRPPLSPPASEGPIFIESPGDQGPENIRADRLACSRTCTSRAGAGPVKGGAAQRAAKPTLDGPEHCRRLVVQ